MISQDPRVSFIIPCFQCRRTIGFTLQSILAQETNLTYEILVVDSSPDGVSSWIRSTYPAVRVLKENRRLFAGAARNLGAQIARGQILAFVDADVRLETNWLQALSEKLLSDPAISLISGAVCNANAGSAASRVLYWIEFSEFQPGLKGGRRAFLSSSNLLVRRQEFLEAGRFKEDWAMCEDLLFCKHLQGGIFFESGVRVYHHHRSRWRQVGKHLYDLGYWSGRLRSEQAFEGSGLACFPLLSFLLPFWRAARIGARVCIHDRREGLRYLIHLPLVLAALFRWSFGFYKGLDGKPTA